MRFEARTNELLIPHLKRDFLAIYSISLMVRVAGVSWGGIDMDESINKVVLFLSGQPKPIDFQYPHLASIISAISCGLMFLIGRFFGFIDSINEFREIYYTNDEAFRVAARCAHSTIASLIGPISYLVTRYFGFARRIAIVIALTTTLTPVGVWFSHFAKPQNGMTVGTLAATMFGVAYMTNVLQRKFAIGMGISAGIAIAFAQSAIFLLVPLSITTLAHSLSDPRGNTKGVLRDGLIALGTTVSAWAVLSILDVIYLFDFLEYKVYQSRLSFGWRGSFSSLYSDAFPVAISPTRGFGPIAFILVPVAAIFSKVGPIKWVSCALILSIFLIAWTVGDRVMPHLFLQFVITLVALSSLSFASLTEQVQPRLRLFGWFGMSALFLANCWGSGLVLQQAWSTPASTLVGRELRKLVTPKGPLVMTADIRDSGLRPSTAAKDLTYARHKRLAEKYNITIPPYSPQRSNYVHTQGGYPIISIPWVVEGLETANPEDIKIVKPYSWPVQPEEWDLDYWLNKRVMIYVTRDLEYYTSDNTTVFYRSFHQELVKRCKLISYINVGRPLFAQTKYHIFDCREAP
ncbi:MAG: hypothetical protein KTR25_10595 [Myxococcales bacterium]|nr:hypothetical protein [Myxococcales bacterium]